MSLDHSLPTLLLGARPGKTGWIDFTSKERNVADYTAVKEEADKIYLIDALSEAHHATLTHLNHKLKLVELQSPPEPVELKETGSVLFEWSFVWEKQKYSWRRDAMGLGSQKSYTLFANFGKGDPDFSVAHYRPGKLRGSLQQLSYNIRRLEPPINDLKGFEILVLITLVAFADHHFTAPYIADPTELDPATQKHLANSRSSTTGTLAPPRLDGKGKGKESNPLGGWAPSPDGREPSGAMRGSSPGPRGNGGAPPPRPPQPTLQTQPPIPVDPNEIDVREPNMFGAYKDRALHLLEDKNQLYITLISRNTMLAGATAAMAEDVKRTHYKQTGEDLMTFLQTFEDHLAPKPPPPPPSGSKHYVPPTPPSALKIFISRIPLDLGQPGTTPTPKKPKPILRPVINFDRAPDPPIPTYPSSSSRPGTGTNQYMPGPGVGQGAVGAKLTKSNSAQGHEKTGSGSGGGGGGGGEEKKSWFGRK